MFSHSTLVLQNLGWEIHEVYVLDSSFCFLNHMVLIGWLYQSLMSRFNVQGFPTILLFGADKDSPIPYEGARSASAIESFALEQLETNIAPPEVTELTGPVSPLLYFQNFLWNHNQGECINFIQVLHIGCHGREMWVSRYLFCIFPSWHSGFQGRREEQVHPAVIISCREVQKEFIQVSWSSYHSDLLFLLPQMSFFILFLFELGS